MSDAFREPTASPHEALADVSADKIWGTKGISFWTLLGAILIKARPTSLLELGSGRSTTFLADYAFRHGAECVSIEHSETWHRKAIADLKHMAVKGAYVHHVPLVARDNGPAWYDLTKMQNLIGERTFDVVFVDGPVGETRRNPSGQELIAKAAREARLVIVDDVHRKHNDKEFLKLSKKFSNESIFYYRYNKNLIALATDEWRSLTKLTFEFLELEYARSRQQAFDAMDATTER